MYFSEAYGISTPDQQDWLDPILEIDTPLFVDPFLMFLDNDNQWKHAHDKMMDYFHQAFTVLARSGLKKRNQFFQRALTLMEFPEVKEVRLGYTKSGSEGLGTGRHLARLIVDAMSEAIKRGIRDVRHFEELGILVDGIDRDRISDITCTLLKPELIEYTQRRCSQLQVPTQPCEVRHSSFDEIRNRWTPAMHHLPVDPRTGEAIILVPKRFVRELPTINAKDWWEEDGQLRSDLNLRISTQVRKHDILREAKSNTDGFKEWVERTEDKTPDPYDVDNDPKLIIKWQRVAHQISTEAPIDEEFSTIESIDDLNLFVQHCIDRFRHWVEDKGGWRLFWADLSEMKSVPEPNMQLMFQAVLGDYCRLVNISLDREVETGRGPVDFTFSSSSRVRMIVEMKKLNNGDFWHGFKTQTPIYLRSQEVKKAVYLVVRNSNTKAMTKRWRSLTSECEKMSKELNFDISVARVDALPKESASVAHEAGNEE